jgi:type VI secretion system secreted protein VgrG
MVATGSLPTGAGTTPGVGLLALGAWNLQSATVAKNRGLKLWDEAFTEDWSDASWRNLLGVLPWGDRYDEPCEPTIGEFFRQELRELQSGAIDWWEVICEIGTGAG